ncbi:MAG: hypothetical protein HY812_15425 [Planctomycetes bacterium]|nr:hypothetical protein [Planctomycetota bacterium]
MGGLLLRSLAWGAAACALFAAAAAGDVVHLKGGQRIEGEVVKDDGVELELKTRFGTQRIPRSQIERIERCDTAAQEIEKRLAALAPGDAEGRYQAALAARDAGLRKRYREILLEVVAIDPLHEQANLELGKVKYQGRYVTPEERERLEQEARRAEMAARGLVEHEGRFVTPEEKEKLESGLVLREGKWIEQDEAMRLGGFVSVDGQWVRAEDAAADETRARAEDVVGGGLSLEKTEHIAVYTDVPGEFGAKLAKLLEKGFLQFAKEFGTGQALDWLGGRRVDVFAFRLRFAYEKYIDHLGATGMGQAWAERARRVISIYRYESGCAAVTYMANKGEAFTAGHCANMLGHTLINRYRCADGGLPPFFDEAFAALVEFDLLGRNVVFSLGSGRYERSLQDGDRKFFEDGRWTEALRECMRGLYDTPLDQAVRRDHGEMLQMDVAKGMALFVRWRSLGPDRLRVFFDALRDAWPAGELPSGHALVRQAIARAFHAVEERDIPVVDKELRAFVMTKMQ